MENLNPPTNPSSLSVSGQSDENLAPAPLELIRHTPSTPDEVPDTDSGNDDDDPTLQVLSSPRQSAWDY